MKYFFVTLGLLLLAGCAGVPEKTTSEERVLTPTSMEALPGWNNDKISKALPALRLSCGAMAKKPDWAQACNVLASVRDGDEAAARHFISAWFNAYAVSNGVSDEGLFTGYYEAELHGSLTHHGAYKIPLYARPNDLITVDLGEWKPEWKGKKISGKVVGQNLKLYDDSAAIRQGSLASRAKPLVWVDSATDAFFLAVQGSGRVTLDNGAVMRLGYDSANGRDYIAIGRKLADSGIIARPVTMQSIRAWLAANPNRADEVMGWNPSYVFFRELKTDPVGAQGVPLTPQRSLAVDTAFIPLGAPVWLDTADGEGKKLQRLMVAQDTGGAIKGVVRGDFFWGFGHEAERQAGAMQSRGRYFLLLPKNMTPHE